LVKKEHVKKKAKRTIIYFYMILILLVLTVTASYTWFSISRTPKVSNMNVYITTQPGLEMSIDKEEWLLQLDFWEAVNATTEQNPDKERPVLRPVTWSEVNKCFYAAAYGADGRLKPYRDWHVLSDERNANKQNFEGYYIKATVFMRSGQNAEITLSPAVEVNDGIDGSGTYVRGIPVWNPGYYVEEEDDDGNILHKLVGFGHDNSGLGAENAIRVGFLVTHLIQSEEGEYLPDEEREPEFFIYEPNCNIGLSGEREYIPTPSMDETETLVPPERLILQTATTWTEADPIENGVVIHTFGELLEPPTIFKIEAGEIVQVDLYFWLEGQDIDCLNSGSEAQIQANLQFFGTTESQSGFVKIE